MSPAPGFAIRATILHTPARDRIEHLARALITVNGDGTISAVHTSNDPAADVLADAYRAQDRLVEAGPDQVLLPGLVDLHIHAPQWPQLGTCLDVPLQDWLWRHTFPLEARYADLAFADPIYRSLVASLLANGTTTAVYFATIHGPASTRLAEICLERGQRALVGLVAMDDAQQCPPDYRHESAAAAEAATRSFIADLRGLPGNEAGLVRPIITPRFIPSCSDDLLRRLGIVARETGCAVQTHCSESDWEHRFVLDRCGVTDAAALDGFGLLTPKTILAHGNHLTDADLDRIKAAGSVVAHCPLSNVFFAGAAFPLRRVLDRGVKVGLGTDIAGGASPSVLETARHAVIQSRSLESGVDAAVPADRRGVAASRIDPIEAFWLATAAGGAALGLRIGQLAPGYQFDALLVDTGRDDSNLACRPGDPPDSLLQRILFLASRADIHAVWVAGRRVAG